MKKSEKLLEICRKFHIALLYAFGSQRDNAIKILNFEKVDIHDPLTDIDIGVVFEIDIEKKLKIGVSSIQIYITKYLKFLNPIHWIWFFFRNVIVYFRWKQ